MHCEVHGDALGMHWILPESFGCTWREGRRTLPSASLVPQSFFACPGQTATITAAVGDLFFSTYGCVCEGYRQVSHASSSAPPIPFPCILQCMPNCMF